MAGDEEAPAEMPVADAQASGSGIGPSLVSLGNASSTSVPSQVSLPSVDVSQPCQNVDHQDTDLKTIKTDDTDSAVDGLSIMQVHHISYNTQTSCLFL